MRSLDIAELGERPHTFSPHLDDGVLSTGALQHALSGARADARIVTVMSGAPARIVTGEWNSFTTGEVFASNANQVRIREDFAAVEALRARAIHLGFYDEPYLNGEPRDKEAIIDAMEAVLRAHEASSVSLPVGIHHPDHIATSDFGMVAAERAGYKEVILYTDVPYNSGYGGEYSQRIGAIARRGALEKLEPFQLQLPEDDTFDKIRIAKMYESQFEPLRADHGDALFMGALQAPEQYWRLTL